MESQHVGIPTNDIETTIAFMKNLDLKWHSVP